MKMDGTVTLNHADLAVLLEWYIDMLEEYEPKTLEKRKQFIRRIEAYLHV